MKSNVFKPQRPNQCIKAVGRRIKFEEKNKKNLRYLYPDKDFFKRIKNVNCGTYLDLNPNYKGQTYDSYISYLKINKLRNKIYVLPLNLNEIKGLFNIDDYFGFLKAFFTDKVEIKLFNNKKIQKEVKNVKTREGCGYGEQINVKSLVKIIKKYEKEFRHDMYAMIVITLSDIYPSDNYNFVYGYSLGKERICVYSLARFFDERYPMMVFRKAVRVSVHEISHLFGLRHCIYYKCRMNGSNGESSDSENNGKRVLSKMIFCPICMRKLKKNIGFDIENRYLELLKMFKKYEELFPSDVNWIENRIKFVNEKAKSMKKQDIINLFKC